MWPFKKKKRIPHESTESLIIRGQMIGFPDNDDNRCADVVANRLAWKLMEATDLLDAAYPKMDRKWKHDWETFMANKKRGFK